MYHAYTQVSGVGVLIFLQRLRTLSTQVDHECENESVRVPQEWEPSLDHDHDEA